MSRHENGAQDDHSNSPEGSFSGDKMQSPISKKETALSPAGSKQHIAGGPSQNSKKIAPTTEQSISTKGNTSTHAFSPASDLEGKSQFSRRLSDQTEASARETPSRPAVTSQKGSEEHKSVNHPRARRRRRKAEDVTQTIEEELPRPLSSLDDNDSDDHQSIHHNRTRQRRRQDVDIEQKREASRISSRRSQERQKRRIEYLTSEEARITQANLKQKADNDALRKVIQHIQQIARVGSSPQILDRSSGATSSMDSSSPTPTSRGDRIPPLAPLQSFGEQNAHVRNGAGLPKNRNAAGLSQHQHFGPTDAALRDPRQYLGGTGQQPVVGTNLSAGQGLSARAPSFLPSLSASLPQQLGLQLFSLQRNAARRLAPNNPLQQNVQSLVEGNIRHYHTSQGALAQPSSIVNAQNIQGIASTLLAPHSELSLSALLALRNSTISATAGSRPRPSGYPFQIASNLLQQQSHEQLLGTLSTTKMQGDVAQLVTDARNRTNLGAALLRGGHQAHVSIPLSTQHQESTLGVPNRGILSASLPRQLYNIAQLSSQLSTAARPYQAQEPPHSITLAQYHEILPGTEIPTRRSTPSHSSNTASLEDEYSSAQTNPQLSSSSSTRFGKNHKGV